MRPRNPYYAGPASDHFDGLRFHNLAGEPDTDRGWRDIWRWQREKADHRWPDAVAVAPLRPEPQVEGLRVTMVGHATVLIQCAGLNILTDPVWGQRASPLSFAGPRRVTAPGIALADLPRIDAVLLSHNHYDHMDMPTLRALHAAHAPLIVTPLGNDRIIQRRIGSARVQALDWGQKVALSARVEAHCVPALHWSSRSGRDRRMALWCGFVLRADGRQIYFPGDTGYGSGAIFRKIGADFGPIDLALLPIGAYAPRWFMAPQHTDPADAIAIMQDIGARRALAIHWGTFKLTEEPREEPLAQLAQGLAARGIAPERFAPLRPGDSVAFD